MQGKGAGDRACKGLGVSSVCCVHLVQLDIEMRKLYME